MLVIPQRIRSIGEIMMIELFQKLGKLLVLMLITSSCASEPSYFIPPSSPPTQAVAIEVLSPPVKDPVPSSLLPTMEEVVPTEMNPLPMLTPTIEMTSTEISESVPIGSGISMDVLPTLQEPTLVSETQIPQVSPSPASEVFTVNTAPILYYAQAADTLPAVAVRFGVSPDDIKSSEPIPETEFINPGQLLIIPRKLTNTTSSEHLIPDSEVVNSPSAVNFDAVSYADQAGGHLSTYEEWHRSTGMKSGAEIVMRVAIENSINPRLLLALLEYHTQLVTGQPRSPDDIDYPMGYKVPSKKLLYNQLVWTVNQLSVGYYAYREGRLTEVVFKDGISARLAPDLNAGTAALQYYFAQLYNSQEWLDAINTDYGFPALHMAMFGDPWKRSHGVEPLFPAGIQQPMLILPFMRNWTWAFTGGPHGAWEREGAYAALDFAPGSTEAGCVESRAWATAAAAGLVVRTGPGLVVIDLDGDGHEQTGWVLVYLHIAEKERVPEGSWVATGDPIGHPSCEGGYSTGTHIHIARKYNGEWVPADGPLPFNLGGWIAHADERAYKGTLTRDGVTVTACTCSSAATFITRTDKDP
jgi:LasA protease